MKGYLYILLSLFTWPIFAQQSSMREAFLEAPEVMIPILTQNNKVEMLKAYDALQEGRLTDRPVSNRLGGKSVVTQLTESFMLVSLDEDTEVQLKLMPLRKNDFLISMIVTSKIVPEQSVISFYKANWEQIPTEDLFEMPALSKFFSDPSKLTLNETKKVMSEIGTLSYRLAWDPNTPTLNIRISTFSHKTMKGLYSRVYEMLAPEGVNYYWGGRRFELKQR